MTTAPHPHRQARRLAGQPPLPRRSPQPIPQPQSSSQRKSRWTSRALLVAALVAALLAVTGSANGTGSRAAASGDARLGTLPTAVGPSSDPSFDDSPLLDVDLTGSHTANPTGTIYRGTVSGPVSPTGRGSSGHVAGFEFNAPCWVTAADTSCVTLAGTGVNLTWTWDFGDGRTATTNSPAAPDSPTPPGASSSTGVLYSTPGVYTVRVTVTGGTPGTASSSTVRYRGTAALRVLVSPQFTDVTPVTGSVTAIWAAGALGWLGDCGAGADGRARFCAGEGLPTVPETDEPAGDPAAHTTNGIFTNWLCAEAAYACGLPAQAWGEHQPGGAVGNPEDPRLCNASCRAALSGRLDAATGAATHQVGVCEDNWRYTPASPDTPAEPVPGVEAGCATYNQFVSSLVSGVDTAPWSFTDIAEQILPLWYATSADTAKGTS